MLVVDLERCVGCGLCEKGCPYGGIAILPGEKRATVLNACNLCGICIDICVYGALRIDRPARGNDLSGYRGIMVWGEWRRQDGKFGPRDVSLELVAKARQLARTTMEEVSVLLAGPPGLDDVARSFVQHGAMKVYYLEHALLSHYSCDGYSTVISSLVADLRPSTLLLGATPNGRDLAPRIAARLGAGLTADCTELTVGDKGELVQTRPAFGGNIMASIVSPSTRPQMATVRPRTFRRLKADPLRDGEIIRPPVILGSDRIRTRIVDESKGEKDAVDIEEAEILVSIGRGMGCKENIDMARELARELHGAVSSSRALVEAGWMPSARQVGQSGRTVSPRLYLALGISGATQHLVGMSSSDVVVAVNSDPDAPILRASDLGIVGKVEEVVPALLEALRKSK